MCLHTFIHARTKHVDRIQQHITHSNFKNTNTQTTHTHTETTLEKHIAHARNTTNMLSNAMRQRTTQHRNTTHCKNAHRPTRTTATTYIWNTRVHRTQKSINTTRPNATSCMTNHHTRTITYNTCNLDNSICRPSTMCKPFVYEFMVWAIS